MNTKIYFKRFRARVSVVSIVQQFTEFCWEQNMEKVSPQVTLYWQSNSKQCRLVVLPSLLCVQYFRLLIKLRLIRHSSDVTYFSRAAVSYDQHELIFWKCLWESISGAFEVKGCRKQSVTSEILKLEEILENKNFLMPAYDCFSLLHCKKMGRAMKPLPFLYIRSRLFYSFTSGINNESFLY